MKIPVEKVVRVEQPICNHLIDTALGHCENLRRSAAEAVGDAGPFGGFGEGFHDDEPGAFFVAAVQLAIEAAGEGFGVVRDHAHVRELPAERDVCMREHVSGPGFEVPGPGSKMHGSELGE